MSVGSSDTFLRGLQYDGFHCGQGMAAASYDTNTENDKYTGGNTKMI